MEDVLSQEEIDLLIRSAQEELDAPEVESPMQIERYDFRRPNKFAKEHMRALQRIFDQFCRTYSGLMSAKLRARLDLRVNLIEQMMFGEFHRSLPNPSVLVVLNVEELGGNMIIQLTPETATLLHDRLCGGSGRLDRLGRGLTDIEMAVLQRQVITVFCQLLHDAWQEVQDLSFELDMVESNPQFLQVASESDVAVLITLSVDLGGAQDMINICIPFRTLEPVMKRLTKHRFFESLAKPDPEKVQQLNQKVRSVVLPLEVELGTSTVAVQDLLELEAGDVILLERRRNETLDVKVGSLTKFQGTPGKLGKRLGLVITAVAGTEGE